MCKFNYIGATGGIKSEGAKPVFTRFIDKYGVCQVRVTMTVKVIQMLKTCM